MRRFTGYMILSAVSLLAFAAHAQEWSPNWSIDVPTPRKQVVKREEIVLYCRSEKQIEGCTEFLGEVLRCECRKSGEAWTMTARAQLVPYMYLSRPAIEEHERLHLDDLRAQLAPYLTELTGRRFEDAESCRSAAEFESVVFTLRMDMLRKLSNRRLH